MNGGRDVTADDTRGILKDFLIAVGDEWSAVERADKQWCELEHPVLKPLANGDLLLSASDLDGMLQEGAETVARLDRREFRAEVIDLSPGGMTLRIEQCDVKSVRECQVRVLEKDFLRSLQEFLTEQLAMYQSTTPAKGDPALANALASPWSTRSVGSERLTYLLGAPGSGKTEALVTRAMDLARRGEKVAIVSYTNAAADAIFERMATRFEGSTQVAVTRLGVTERALMVEDTAASEAICVERSIESAVDTDVLVTTAYRALRCAEKHAGEFTVVLIDEASTMPLALVWVAALLAHSRVGLYGDPYQLGPIALAQVDTDRTPRQHFGTSPFEVDGVMDAVARDSDTMVLRGQHRLPSSLASAILAPLYLSSRGVSASADESQTPWGSGGLLFIDTTKLNPTCEPAGSSRRNRVHADLVVECVRALLEQGVVDAETVERDLLIVTPYRGQRVDITRVLADQEWFSGKQLRELVTTIHRAQGSERSYVLVDTVEAHLADRPDLPPIGRLWAGKGWQSPGGRLLTTALTRARIQALVVMCRAVAGTASNVESPEAKALPRLNAMLDGWGRPADIRAPSDIVRR